MVPFFYIMEKKRKNSKKEASAWRLYTSTWKKLTTHTGQNVFNSIWHSIEKETNVSDVCSIHIRAHSRFEFLEG